MAKTATRSWRSALVAAAFALLLPAAAASAYPWPLAPFHQPHPVRGNFGDPRTVFFHGALNPEGLAGDGKFSFHNGVDIAAAGGTPVYPVESGVTTAVTTTTVGVRAAGDRIFTYVHIFPLVLSGQHVVAQKTALGVVMPSAGHVHLTEIRNGRLQNPLAPGHLTPYSDTTQPRITDIALRSATNTSIPPDDVRGPVSVVAAALDTPELPLPGSWAGVPVTPAALQWWVTSFSGRTVVPRKTPVDFRTTLPGNGSFWRVYARGTFQNHPRFGNRQYEDTPGRYEFRLTPSPFDTRRLPNGVYAVHVRALDTRGNTGGRTLAFTVCNTPGPVCTPARAP
jgi:hypothetical protein